LMKAMSPLYSGWRWPKLPIPQILPSQSQSDPNTPRRKKARYLPERPSQQRRPMSPYIVRLGPVRERKRQPEQVPGNGALGSDHSLLASIDCFPRLAMRWRSSSRIRSSVGIARVSERIGAGSRDVVVADQLYPRTYASLSTR